MTDKERFERKCMLSWYRTQLSILEDIIYYYENGIASFEKTEEVFERNVKYMGVKYLDGYLPEDLYIQYTKEAEEVWEYIIMLGDVKGGDPMCGNVD